MTTSMAEIHGECDARFSAVRETFAENFARFGDVGAAVAVTIDGKPVIDLWGGITDKESKKPRERDTLVTVYSTTKGMTAICAHRLVEQDRLDLNAPASKYWPEFAQAGKAEVPVHMLLSHRAGLPTVSEKLPDGAVFDWDAMTGTLARQQPFWEPGTRHGYHGLTYGWLVGEVVRRISGKSLGAFFRDEVATPLGLDFHIGLDPQHDRRVATMYSPIMSPEAARRMEERQAEVVKAMSPGLAQARGNISIQGDTTPRNGAGRRYRPPTATATPGPWPECMEPCRAMVSWTESTSLASTQLRGRRWNRQSVRTRCYPTRPGSGWVSGFAWTGTWDQMIAASDIRGRVAP